MKIVTALELAEREIKLKYRLATNSDCRVFWQHHGCYLERGHEGSHECVCGEICYSRPDTHAFGEDL